MGEKPIEETAGKVGEEREGNLQWTSAILYTLHSLPLYVVVVNKYVPNNSIAYFLWPYTHPIFNFMALLASFNMSSASKKIAFAQ